MEVRVTLTKGVSLPLKVEDGTVVKELRDALALLGCSDVEILAEGKVLADDDSVPGTMSVQKTSRHKAPASPGKSMIRSQTLRAKKTSSLMTPSTPTKVEKKREESKVRQTPLKEKKEEKEKKEKGEKDEKKKEEKKEKEKKEEKKKEKSENGPKKESVCLAAPDLKDIRERISKVQATDLRKIAALSSPPIIIKALVEHVMLALGLTHKSWSAMANELSDIRFIKKVCDAEPLFPDRTIRKLEAYTIPPLEDLKKIAGPAPVILTTWLQAMIASAKGKKTESTTESEREESKKHPAPKEHSKKTSDSPHSTPDTQPLVRAAEELSNLKNSDFREFRSIGKDKPPAVVAPLAAMQAALGMKDTSLESALKMIINPSTFVKTLVEAANDPEKHLHLEKSEFLILQKHIHSTAMNQEYTEKSLPALPAISKWAKAAYHYNMAFHKEKHRADKSHTNGQETPKGDAKAESSVERNDEEAADEQVAEQEQPVADEKQEEQAEVAPPEEAAKEDVPEAQPEVKPEDDQKPEPETEQAETAEEQPAEEEKPEAQAEEGQEKADAAQEEHVDPKSEQSKQWGDNETFEDEY